MGRIARATVAIGAVLIITSRIANADPVTPTGVFVLDHEFGAVSFGLAWTISGVPIRVSAPDNIALSPVPAGLTFGCEPRCLPGSTFDFSNATTGVQPFGSGSAMIGDVLHANVNFSGAFTFNSPGAILPGPPSDFEDPGFFPRPSAPFTFSGTLIGQQEGGAQLFSADLRGTGSARTTLFWNGEDAFRLDEGAVLAYVFDAGQPTPEPGSLLLIGTGIVAACIRRRRTTAAPASVS